MSNFRRRLMCKKTESELPEGYTRLNYLESTGTQWIDTHILSNNGTGCEMRFEYTEVGGIQYAVGLLELGNARFAPIFIDNQSNTPNGFLYSDSVIFEPKTYTIEKDKNIHLIRYNCNDNGDVIFDNKNCGNIKYIGNSTTSTIYLFARSNKEIGEKCAYIKIYECSLYDKGKRARNYLPAIDMFGKPCLYDTVTKQPFYNQGTGEFLYG